MTPRLRRSIALRLVWVTGLGSLLIAMLVALATSMAVNEEVDELLDDALQASAQQLAPLLTALPEAAVDVAPQGERFAWLWLDSADRPVRRSAAAQAAWAQQTPASGFATLPAWRVYVHPLGAQGRLLVAQTRAERIEARDEVRGFGLMTGLGTALLGLPLLAWRAARELQPLHTLAAKLQSFDPKHLEPRSLAQVLGEPEREELREVHRALEALSQRLHERLQFERGFAVQAAHLLRTPLAGMDAQLAVAQREQPDLPRLVRVREALQRLQQVVLALLRLFRSEPEVQRQPLEARALLADLPLGSLKLAAGAPCPVLADAELLRAALLNLIDNAQRHGARTLHLSLSAPQTLLLQDDGSGLPGGEAALADLRTQLADGTGGLGLRLAQLVAQAHGGDLFLLPVPQGFAVQLRL